MDTAGNDGAAPRRVADEIALRYVRRIRESAHAKLLGDDTPQAAGEADFNGKVKRGLALSVEQRRSGKRRTQETNRDHPTADDDPTFRADDASPHLVN